MTRFWLALIVAADFQTVVVVEIFCAAWLKMRVKYPHFAHLKNKPSGFADLALQVIVGPPCEEALYQSSVLL